MLCLKINSVDRIKEFQAFDIDDVASAAAELGGLKEKRRRHFQQLVYTNLAKTVKLSFGSISIASEFRREVIALLLANT